MGGNSISSDSEAATSHQEEDIWVAKDTADDSNTLVTTVTTTTTVDTSGGAGSFYWIQVMQDEWIPVSALRLKRLLEEMPVLGCLLFGHVNTKYQGQEGGY